MGAVLQPLLTMVLFTFTALLPWTYFSQAIHRSGTSLVTDSGLISKVYFPPQLWMYASPVVYPVSMIPLQWR